MKHTLISIHDVMPSTLDCVQRLMDQLAECGLRRVTLLVVPGLAWSSSDLDKIRNWVADGYALAGHGWMHRCNTVHDIFHRIHSWMLSRDVAEHLELRDDEIIDLMLRCRNWFSENDLPIPRLYVPPAWALGRLSSCTRSRIPFEMIETLGGVWFTQTGRRIRLPLVGFEADSMFRQMALRTFNRLSDYWSDKAERPLRIAIHPHDDRLRMSRDFQETIRKAQIPVCYESLPRLSARNYAVN